MEERRQYPRIGISFPVECKTLPSKNFSYTVSKDLSLGGVRVFTTNAIPKGRVIKVNINLIDEVLNLKAKVIWCNKERIANRYSMGLLFVEATNTVKEKLFQFLNKIYS
ncbi:MAG: hypothetical protein DRZ76_04270 [Candidatus Nealsonbacteria bacterium]|nr:MAG: hypothetical protein DRZ76_04270 [Candidatus Nealsonbacteria bacterium]